MPGQLISGYHRSRPGPHQFNSKQLTRSRKGNLNRRGDGDGIYWNQSPVVLPCRSWKTATSSFPPASFQLLLGELQGISFSKCHPLLSRQVPIPSCAQDPPVCSLGQLSTLPPQTAARPPASPPLNPTGCYSGSFRDEEWGKELASSFSEWTQWLIGTESL